jgi:hypothetical protein
VGHIVLRGVMNSDEGKFWKHNVCSARMNGGGDEQQANG